MTGWGQEEDKRHASQAGYDFHLVKPVDLAAPEGLLSSLDLPGGDTVGHAPAPGPAPGRPTTRPRARARGPGGDAADPPGARGPRRAPPGPPPTVQLRALPRNTSAEPEPPA